jgi:hypothetical protein
MTLNASGPISLGGPTTGQSINLELGNSATAVASIDSAPFRTLAGVASGTIALSNFYGKSSNSYWVLAASTSVLNRGFTASANGILCVASGINSDITGTNNIYFFDANGALSKSTAVSSLNDNWSGTYSPKQVYLSAWVNNNTFATPIFYPSGARFYYPYGVAPFNSTANQNLNSSNLWTYGTSTTSTFDSDFSLKGNFTDTSGNVYLSARRPNRTAGKASFDQVSVYSYTSSGSVRWSFRNYQYARDEYQSNYGLVRTDGVVVIIGANQQDKLALITLNASTGAYIQGYSYNRQSFSDKFGNFYNDSSNNLYFSTRRTSDAKPRIFKFNSSYGVSAAKQYNPSPVSGGDGQSGWYNSTYLYNGVIYLFTSTQSASLMQVVAIDPATLLPSWTLNMQFSGATLSNIMGDNGESTIFATSIGIYVGVRINGFNNYFKLPLDGNISVTKAVTAPSGSTGYTVAFTKVTSGTSMVTSSDISFSSTGTFATPTETNAGAAASGGTPFNGVTPVTPLTTL